MSENVKKIKTWEDENGQKWKVSSPGKRLRPASYKSHAVLRRFVFRRDKFVCQICGAMPESIPIDYDGESTLYTSSLCKSGYSACLHLDHIKPRSKKGVNHPSNLQTLCESCNARKVDK